MLKIRDDVKLKELEKANDLEDSDDIRVGQKLLLP